jgi:DNA-binding IclR family transcriptional regulator
MRQNSGRTATLPPEEQDVARVLGEFREMPGLTLTLAQAARLFDLGPARCERVLGRLVQKGVLMTDGRTFRRAHGMTRARS